MAKASTIEAMPTEIEATAFAVITLPRRGIRVKVVRPLR